MTKVVFIRHGQTEWNANRRYQGQSDVPLSAAGEEQARLLAVNFPVEHLDAVYSSDLQRAMFTAKGVADRFGLSVCPEPAFRELCFGKWEGLTYEEIASQWPEAMVHFIKSPDVMIIPDGETFPAVQERAIKRLHELIAMHEGQTIAITAHGAVLRTILATALHMPLKYLWSIRQFNTAINIIRYDKDANPTVELVNGIAHLGEPL